MACDPFWDKTVLACHFDGSNGSTTFVDEKGHTLTANGNAQISTAQSKFGGSSAYFDGDGDYVLGTLTDGLGAGDFTVEYWVMHTSFYNYITNVCTTRGGTGWSCGSQGAAQIIWYSSGTEKVRGVTVMQPNTWYHIAYVRKDGVLKGYLNGVQDGTYNIETTNFTDSNLNIGRLNDGSEFMTGYLDDLRITKGIARYTANFTPDTSAFLTNQCAISGTVKDTTGAFAKRLVRVFSRDTATLVGQTLSDATTGAYSLPVENTGEHFVLAHDSGEPFDSYYSKVLALLSMDGADNGTTFTDAVGNTVTRYGDTKTVTGTKKFGTASAYFDGVGDSLTVAAAGSVSGTGDFTVEAWVNPTSFGSGYRVWLANDTSNGFSSLINSTGTVSFGRALVVVDGTSSNALTFGVWNHIAICRASGTIRIFINGIKGFEAANTTSFVSGAVRIGADGGGSSYPFTGYMDDIRISAVARYSSDFTPSDYASPTTSSFLGTENAVILDRVVPV